MLKNSAAKPLSNSTELEYSFVFEDSSKSISGSNPIEVFYSLADLDRFLEKNPELIEMPEAGFAGYMSYEGDCEFALYEEIKISSLTRGSRFKVRREFDSSFKVQAPDPKQYIQAIKKCQEYIEEGDIYQANIACKYICKQLEVQSSNFEIYEKLKSLNPAPYMGYMNFKDYEIISSSPECFLSIYPLDYHVELHSPRNNSWQISSSPIKGTAKLTELDYLLKSEKERAEHIMILDLIRNDLGRICKPGSIEVPEILASHKFTNLYHLVSTIKGELKWQGLPRFDEIFQACFPGGSITGAPKIRALQIIKELEASPRGPYTGTMGYFRFQDGGKFNILIRTLVNDKINNELSFHVGAGITAESKPEQELQECYLKAEKLLELLGAN